MVELTRKEKLIAEKLVAGYSQQEISEQLNRSRQTIYTHIKNIRRKMDAPTTPALRRMLMNAEKYGHTRYVGESMDIKYRASIITAEWWGSLLMIEDKQKQFIQELTKVIDDKLNNDGECDLDCDYDPKGDLLDALRKCGIECSGSFFSADSILPRQHSSLTKPRIIRRTGGYRNWLDDLHIAEDDVLLGEPS